MAVQQHPVEPSPGGHQSFDNPKHAKVKKLKYFQAHSTN